MARDLLHTLSIWIIVIPFLVGIMNFKGLNRDSRWIFVLICIALTPQLATPFVEQDGAVFDLLYNFYTPIEFIILAFLFCNKYFLQSLVRVFHLTIAVYIGFCIYFYATFGITKVFLGGLVCVNNVIYMVWILMLLKQEYSSERIIIRVENPFMWYMIGLIFYAPCTVATFALYHYIRQPEETALQNLKVIQDVFNILLYLIFSIGLIIRRHKDLFVS